MKRRLYLDLRDAVLEAPPHLRQPVQAVTIITHHASTYRPAKPQSAPHTPRKKSRCGRTPVFVTSTDLRSSLLLSILSPSSAQARRFSSLSTSLSRRLASTVMSTRLMPGSQTSPMVSMCLGQRMWVDETGSQPGPVPEQESAGLCAFQVHHDARV